MTAALPLVGLRVLVTRPEAQAGPLCALLESRGAEALRLPLLEIAPPADTGPASHVLRTGLDADAWIFTSANAARHAEALCGDARWPARLAAVGAATARALADRGDVEHPLSSYSAEALLALPEWQNLQGQKIVLVTGEDGPTFLAEALHARGADLRVAEVYRRLPVAHAPDIVRSLYLRADVVMMTSTQALEHLHALLQQTGTPLAGARLVVSGPRMLEKARALGAQPPPLLAARVSDETYVQTLEHWRAEPPSAAMTDTPATAVPPPAVAALTDEPRRRSLWPLALFLLLLLLAAAAAFAAHLFVGERSAREALETRVAAVQSQLARVETRQTDVAQAAQRNAREIAGFAARMDTHDQSIGQLAEQLGGGRARLQLVAVEQLLLMANDRLQLARDVRAAQAALERADERLGALADPRLFNVREAIAAERAALMAVPQADIAAAALSLSSLSARAPRLPLVARVPERFEAAPQPLAPPSVEGGWAARAWAAMREAMTKIFTLRRNTGSLPRLLPAEEQALVYQILALKLEGARVALLRNDEISFRDYCDGAAQWLDEYFLPADAGVSAAQAELARLRALPLNPPLPEISRSLSLLRAALEPAPQ